MAAPRKVEFVIGARDQTRRALRGVSRRFRNLTRSIFNIRNVIRATITGFAVRAVVNFAKSLEGIGDAADSLKLTTEQFQALVFLAEEVGVSGRDVETVFQRLQRRAGQAADDNDLLLQKFEALGVSLDDLKNKSSIELFDQLLRSYRELGNEIGGARIADILDTEGLRLFRRAAPEFNDFADALARARAGGAIFDASDIKDMEEAAEKLREFQRKFQKTIAPVLSDVVKRIDWDALIAALKNAGDAVREFLNSPLGRKLTQGEAVVPDVQGAARRAGERTRAFLTSGRVTAGGRIIQDLLDELVRIRQSTERQEGAQDRTGASGVYGP